jgi:hypothetical protein
MMAKTQITLETEMQRRARQRANDLGVSLAEYFRRLVARDLARPETAAHVESIFDLGSSCRAIVSHHELSSRTFGVPTAARTVSRIPAQTPAEI